MPNHCYDNNIIYFSPIRREQCVTNRPLLGLGVIGAMNCASYEVVFVGKGAMNCASYEGISCGQGAMNCASYGAVICEQRRNELRELQDNYILFLISREIT